MRFKSLALTALFVVAAASIQAQTSFTATDGGAGPAAPHPLSDAKAAEYDAAAALLGTQSLVTFESAPLGTFTSLMIAPGVTITGINAFGNPFSINNTPNFPTNPALDGFNTTPGGANYLEVLGGTVTITFTDPIQSFGAYFTGVQPVFFTDTITFNDGTSQSITIPAFDATNGGVSFAGFTDPGKFITQITINTGTPNGADFIGIDDIRFGPTASSVPEPGSIALLAGLGITGSLFAVRRLRRRAK